MRLDPRPVTTIAVLALCSLVPACVPSLKGNEPREPNKEVPAAFATGTEDDAGSPAGKAAADATWQQFFPSPELRGLIETALKNNRELNMQLQEIILSQNEVMARRGEYMPKVSGGAVVGVDKVGKHTSQGASDEAHGLPENLGNFGFGLTGTWEVDIWGKLRNAAKAANYRYLASKEARNWMVTQIVAEIARSYFEMIAIDNQIDVLNRNIEIQKNGLEIVRIQKEAARVTELAVQRFEAEVLKNRSRLFELQQERTQAENRINFLVGRYPQPVKRDPEAFKQPLPPGLTAGLPAELLDNRADVRQAELQLEASKLDVKSARAAFYPSLSLDAGLGFQAFNPRHLLATPESMAYGLAANLTAPLLNRKAIEAQYRTANAMQIQAVLNYEQALLQAFADVSNQLAAIENLRKSYELRKQQVETLERSVEISNTLFQSARADYMEVLLTRRDSLEGEMTLVETKKKQLLAVVNIYQALGGGWREPAKDK
jgi:outer membrane protein, multidrug efflux system